MPVYVDNSKNRLGRLICSHMWADTEAELLAMCDKIGFSRLWIQRQGMKPAPNKPPVRWLHCDVSQTMRARAIDAGAMACSSTHRSSSWPIRTPRPRPEVAHARGST